MRRQKSKNVADLEGCRFGKLLVVSATRRRREGLMVWQCKCDCGETTHFDTQDLRYFKNDNCGCASKRPAALHWRKDIRNFQEGPKTKTLQQAYRHLRQGAKKRFLPFNISLEQFTETAQAPCSYCGCKSFPFGGVDRLDSAIGYELDNIAPACGICNRAKGCMTTAEFRAWVEGVFNHNWTVGL